VNPKAHKKKPPETVSIQTVLMNLGVPGIGLGVGLALVTFKFWLAMAFMVGAIILFWWMLLRTFSETQKWQRRGGVFVSLIAGVIIVWAIWVPNSIGVLLVSEPGDYPLDRDIYGIKWKANYSELTLMLDNMSATDLTNVDTYVRTDLMIANVGIAPSINACTSQAWFPAEMTTPKLIGKDAAGNRVSIPALEKNRPITSSIYRIRCDRLLARSSIEIKFAVMQGLFVADKKQPRWAKLWYSLVAGYRPVDGSSAKCFIGENQCPDMPAKLIQAGATR
jgi:hypothetical protein